MSLEVLALLPEQQRFLARRLPAEHHWNLQGVRPVGGCIGSGTGRGAVRRLVARHDALRTVLVAAGDERRAMLVGPDDDVPVSCLDLADVPDSLLKAEIQRRTARFHAEMDLYTWPLFRIVCLHLAGGRHVLLVIVHHLICEEVSFRILLEDLLGLLAGRDPAPGPGARPWASVRELGVHLGRAAATEALRADVDRWCRIADPVAPVPAELGDGSDNDLESSEFAVVALTKAETAEMVRRASRSTTTLRNQVLGAVVRSLSECFEARAVSVRCHSDGRAGVVRPLSVARTVGWLSATYPITFRRPPAGPWREADVLERLSLVPSRGETFGVLRYLSQEPAVVERLCRLGEPDVQMNWLGMRSHSGRLRPVVAAAPFEFVQRKHGSRDSRHSVVAAVVNGHLAIQWGYSRNLYRRTTVEALADRAAGLVRDGLR